MGSVHDRRARNSLGLLLAVQWYFPSAGMAAVTGGEEVVLVKEILGLYNTDVAAACNETWGVPSCLSNDADAAGLKHPTQRGSSRVHHITNVGEAFLRSSLPTGQRASVTSDNAVRSSAPQYTRHSGLVSFQKTAHATLPSHARDFSRSASYLTHGGSFF